MNAKLELELESLKAQINELEEHTQGLEKLIEHIITNCPEARRVILAFSLTQIKKDKE